MIVRHVESVGLELEGGIPKQGLDELYRFVSDSGLEDNYDWGYDGSVRVPPPPQYDYDEWIEDVEIKVWAPITLLDKLLNFVQFAWKIGFVQNETCGNHVHLRFHNNEVVISLLMCEKAIRMFQEKYHQYALTRRSSAKYLQRERNRYCRFYAKQDFPADIVLNFFYSNYRYRAVNFNAFREHGTLEIRVLPHAENAQEYIENLNWLLKTIDDIVEEMFSSSFNLEVDISSFLPLPRVIEDIVE